MKGIIKEAVFLQVFICACVGGLFYYPCTLITNISYLHGFAGGTAFLLSAFVISQIISGENDD